MSQSHLYDQGKYVEALHLAERYVTIANQKYGQSHIQDAVMRA